MAAFEVTPEGHRNHFSSRTAQHHHMGVVNHHALRCASEIAQSFRKKHLAVKTPKGGIALKEHHVRVTQHGRCGLHFVLLAGQVDLVRRGVVLGLFARSELVSARGHNGLLSHTLTAAEIG